MTDGSDRLSEEEAQRVWKRAADLQAARGEPQVRAHAMAAGAGHQPGYSLSQVREAATEAGIAPEFVALALAQGDEVDMGPGDGVDRWAARLAGKDSRALVVSRRFDSPIEDVYAAVQRVFARQQLALVDSHGEPLQGGQLAYAVPVSGGGFADSVVTDLAVRARVEEVRLRMLALDHGSCLATLSAPLGAARRARLGLGAAQTVGGGVVGGWAVGALGAVLVVPLSVGAAAAAAIIGGAVILGLGVGSSLGIAGSRAAHRSGVRRGTAALERLLQAVGIELRGLASEIPSITPSSADREATGRNLELPHTSRTSTPVAKRPEP
jgi:hypothetical protein